eukprot:Tbor_TRINITY_DN6154_c0_g4::TRINITY_DN6154_c0_g4_i1::g.22145::m.22145
MSKQGFSGSPQQSKHDDSQLVQSVERTILSSYSHGSDGTSCFGGRDSPGGNSDTSYPASPFGISKLEDTAEGLRNLIYDLRNEQLENFNQMEANEKRMKVTSKGENKYRNRIKELEERSNSEEMNLTLKQKFKPVKNEAALYAIEAANANSRVLELMKDLQAAESEKERAILEAVQACQAKENEKCSVIYDIDEKAQSKAGNIAGLEQHSDWTGNIFKGAEK